MPGPNYLCHKLNAVCFAKPRGCKARWLMAHVVQSWPLAVEVIEDDPVWKGAVLNQGDACIRVDPRHWPKERRVA